jgi:hypothetical protein
MFHSFANPVQPKKTRSGKNYQESQRIDRNIRRRKSRFCNIVM